MAPASNFGGTASWYTVHLRKSSGSRLAGTCSVKQRNCICHCTESSVNPRTVQQIYSGRAMFRRFTEHVPASLQLPELFRELTEIFSTV